MALLFDSNKRYQDLSSHEYSWMYAPQYSDSRKLTYVEHETFQPVVITASPEAVGAPQVQDEMIDLLTQTQRADQAAELTSTPAVKEAAMGGLGVSGLGGSIGMLVILGVVVGGGYYLYTRSKKG